MDEPVVRIAHLYPGVMNLYGDRGNVITLRHRCAARGIATAVLDVECGDDFDPAACDLVLIGGGQDREQKRVAEDLVTRGPALCEAVAGGLPVLAVCGGYQLFGRRYVGFDGSVIPGIGLFDLETRHPGPRAERCIGDVVVDTELGELAGFENHGGRTHLGPGQAPLGHVTRGFGNNGEDGTEGARTANAFGTYLHGSLLPKNPHFADELLRLALAHRYGAAAPALAPLDDEAERAAHNAAVRTAHARSAVHPSRRGLARLKGALPWRR